MFLQDRWQAPLLFVPRLRFELVLLVPRWRFGLVVVVPRLRFGPVMHMGR